MAAEQNRKIQWAICLFLVLYFYGLTAQAQYGGGSGEPNDPYLIYTAEQLNEIGLHEDDWDKHFKLMADIDLSGYTGTNFNIIGSLYGSFGGVFDGSGHTISNFTYTSTDTNRIGLFGCVYGGAAKIKDLGLINPNIDVDAGTGDRVGSLVGYLASGTITNCYAEGGSISGAGSEYSRGVGGLVGESYSGTITGSYASSTVTGDNSVGGLVGYNNNILTHCYATGNVAGTTNVGGLVGKNGYSGTITHCYATASVTGTADVGGLVGAGNQLALGEITFSFWDIQTSGQSTSASGTGKTTAEMHNPNTFMDAGWDFVGKPDGPSDVWAEPAGGGYPILWWQLSPLPELPTFSGGTGEPEDHYLVSTAADLNIIGHNPRLMRAHFKLTNDIDLAGIDFYIIGSEAFPYTGVFDGNGHTISNFSYTSTDTNYAGLFGYVEGAEFKDLGLIAPDVDAAGGEYVGSLVASNGGTIINCYVEGGSVSGRNYVGGLVGRNNYGTITNCYAQGGSVMGSGSGVGGLVGKNSWGTITDCYATVSILGNTNVGGIAGYNLGTIINCYANGSVTGYLDVGGMAGYNSDTIINCYASGSVSGERDIGGMAGYNHYGKIINCCASGNVTGYEYVGGMVGSIGYFPSSRWSFSPPPPPAKISNCYSTGDVTGNRIVGGLVGWLIYNSTITNCYSTGSVSGNFLIGGLLGVKGLFRIYVPDFSGITGDTISDFYSTANITGNTGVGQPVGEDLSAPVINSFWDTETSGQVRSMGGIGKTTAEMQTASTFFDAGWDFMGETKNGTEDIWWILEGQDYPRLWWQLSAFSSFPQDGAIDVTQPIILQWAPGRSALYHDIYFGEDEDAVKKATTGSPEYKGSRDLSSESYNPGKLALDTTYYWRIDEVNEAEPNNFWKGNIWSFTTSNFLVVDDFEDYNERIFDFWIDGWGTPTNGSTVSILSDIDPYFNPDLWGFNVPGVHGGEWSMACFYDNTTAKYSEATMTLVWPRNWTQDGVGVLSLWFNGDPDNAPEPMYVALANVNGPPAMVYHDNPDAALIDTWTEWRIGLQVFADQGVDLTNVNTITLGLGNRTNPIAGASGEVWFDDIRLYPSIPEL